MAQIHFVLTSVFTSMLMSLLSNFYGLPGIEGQVMMDIVVPGETTVTRVDNATGTLNNLMGGGLTNVTGVRVVSRNRTVVSEEGRTVLLDRESGLRTGESGGTGGTRERVVRVDRDRGVAGGTSRTTVVGGDRDGGVAGGATRDTVVRTDGGVVRRNRTVVGDRDGIVLVDRASGSRTGEGAGVGGTRDTIVGVDRDRGVVGGASRTTVVGGDRDSAVAGTRVRDTVVGVDLGTGVAGGAVRERTLRVDRDRGLRAGVSRDTIVRLDRDRTLGLGGNDTERTTMLTAAQRELNARCALKCKTELCYLADDDDCRNFITCQQDAQRRYHATLQPCAFGTYWAGLQRQKKITCDIPENVRCNIDYCGNKPAGFKYDHTDGNCKTYWECDKLGRSVPRCCPDGYRYDIGRQECVEDRLRLCHDTCPIKLDACLITGRKTEFFDDGNCRTYWNCEDQHPHPVCCPEGQGYDVIEGCIPMRLCNNTCPQQYKPDICLQPGIERYSLLDGSCRTYMKCNPMEGDERWCCPSNFVFDSNSQSCIERTLDMDLTCDDTCPMFYKEMCHLKPVPERPDHYFMTIHGAEMERPCAPGTLFDITKCGCATVVKNSPDNSCNKELDIVFDHPMWNRAGSQSQVEIINVGTLEEGPKLNGRTSFYFNGDLYFRTPFFQSQYDNLYIKLVFLPETSATAAKQVLLSNCMNLDLGAPSMELSLQNSQLVLDLVTDNILHNASIGQTGPVRATVPYTPGVWNTFTAIYNGRDVYLLNEGQGAPSFDRQTVTGPISVAAEGLDFGGCYINRGSGEGFVGSLAQLEFSKCLKQGWVDVFNSNIPRE